MVGKCLQQFLAWLVILFMNGSKHQRDSVLRMERWLVYVLNEVHPNPTASRRIYINLRCNPLILHVIHIKDIWMGQCTIIFKGFPKIIFSSFLRCIRRRILWGKVSLSRHVSITWGFHWTSKLPILSYKIHGSCSCQIPYSLILGYHDSFSSEWILIEGLSIVQIILNMDSIPKNIWCYNSIWKGWILALRYFYKWWDFI